MLRLKFIAILLEIKSMLDDGEVKEAVVQIMAVLGIPTIFTLVAGIIHTIKEAIDSIVKELSRKE